MFKTIIKNNIIALIFFVVFAVPISVQAQTTLTFSSQQEYIEYLVSEVERLQTLLEQIIAVQEGRGARYNQEFSTQTKRYEVVNGTLLSNSGAIDRTHLRLFEHLQDVIGVNTVNKYIKEFQVGYVSDGGLENYIEGRVYSDSTRDSWDFKIKRDSSRDLTVDELDLLTELYIHEYGHIIFEEQKNFVNSFIDEFWSADTYRKSDRVSAVFAREGYAGLDDELYGYRDEFVSGYAMLSPDEDMAETFAHFVDQDNFSTDEIVEEKMFYFYKDNFFRNERQRLRANINRLGY